MFDRGVFCITRLVDAPFVDVLKTLLRNAAVICGLDGALNERPNYPKNLIV